jgi:hypothetical protein
VKEESVMTCPREGMRQVAVDHSGLAAGCLKKCDRREENMHLSKERGMR